MCSNDSSAWSCPCLTPTKSSTAGCEIHLVLAVMTINNIGMSREDHLSREARRRLAGDVGGGGGCVLDKAEEKVGVWNEGEDGRVGGGVSLCAGPEGEVGGDGGGPGRFESATRPRQISGINNEASNPSLTQDVTYLASALE